MSSESINKAAPFDFSLNYFQLFQLPENFIISLPSLEENYLLLQKKIHPDKFASDPKSQLLAVHYASFINEGYDTLRSQLKRAQYLLQLQGVDTDFDSKTINDQDFLMEQMEIRDQLSEVKESENPHAALNKLTEQVQQKIESLENQFCELWRLQTTNSLSELVNIVHKMFFLYKFMNEARTLEEHILGL